MSKIYLLNNEKFQNVLNLPLFEIKYLKSEIDLLQYDALVFTSKNAIYSLNSFSKIWKNIPAYAIAKKTADVIIQNGGKLEFTGLCSHGDGFAKELIPKLKNKKVLYICAKKTVSNLVGILKDENIDITTLVTYETICSNKTKLSLHERAIIIFSSPSSVEGFFKYYTWKESYRAIVIGKTTSKYLPSHIKYILSPNTSLETCVKIANEL